MPSLCQIESQGSEADRGTRTSNSDKGVAKRCVIVADDHQEVLRTAVAALEDEFQIIAQATNGADVLKLVPVLRPEALVLDISMPIVDGMETALELKTTGSSTNIIFLTVHEDPEFLDAAVSAGAQAYVLKGRLASDLVRAVRSALDGRFFVSPQCKPPDESGSSSNSSAVVWPSRVR